MYRTADNIEDLDIEQELYSYESVSHIVDRSGMWGIGEEYMDSDFYIYMLEDRSEQEQIAQLLRSEGYKAYLDYGDENPPIKID